MKRILMMFAVFAAVVATAAEFETKFKSGYDGTEQRAAGWVPDGTGKSGEARPLLVVVHFMGGDRFSAKKLGYYEAAAKRGWLVVAPELHGKNTPGQTSFAALEAQHDVIDAVSYMKENYNVDATRIYIAGRSMGGQLTAMMLAKYPDLFAAGVAGQGCYDLSAESHFCSGVAEAVRRETGGEPFELRRRSAINYARNLAYVPIVLWHGTNDDIVSPRQSETLFDVATRFQPMTRPVFWLVGNGHLNANVSAEWVCSQLAPFQNTSDLGPGPRFYPTLDLITDEAKSIFYLDITPADPGKFAHVAVSLTADFDRPVAILGAEAEAARPVTMRVRCENVKSLTVNLDLIPEPLRPAKFVADAAGLTPSEFSVEAKGVRRAEDIAIAADDAPYAD